MATLQKLRDRGPLIAIVIGIALLAFILGSLIKQGRTLLHAGKMHVAVINGTPIDVNYYEQKISTTEDYVKAMQNINSIDEATSMQIRSSVWDDIIKQTILEPTYKQLGIDVTTPELEDMAWGNNVHPIIRQVFVNPNTGQFDKQMVINVVKNLNKDPKLKQIWLYIEDYIVNERKYKKYEALVTKGLFANKLDVEEGNKDRKTLYDVNLVAKTVNEVQDGDVSFTDDDVKNYYENHKFLFDNHEKSADLEFVSFDVVPSKADSEATFNEALKIKDELLKSQNEQSIVNARSNNPQIVHFYSPEEIHNEGLDTLYSFQDNSIYGPYFKNGSYWIVKIIKKEERPDTVSARHILISPKNPKVGTIDRANEIADSLIQVLKNGGDFEKLVAQYSDDQGSVSKGGLYENITEGQMVPEFNDYVFTHDVNEIGKVQTTYGVHIVEVVKKSAPVKKIKLAFVQLEINPSENTYNKYRAIALQFRSKAYNIKDFEDEAQKENLKINEAPNITQGTYKLYDMNNVRELVRWAFNEDTKVGNVSEVLQFGDKYLVATLIRINPVGYYALDKVKNEVENSVRNEKKVEKLYNDYFANAKTNDLNAFAKSIKTVNTQIPHTSFDAYQIGNIGYEPKFFANLSVANLNQIVGPVKGRNSVFVFKVTKITPAPELSQDQLTKQMDIMTKTLQRRNYSIYPALKAAAKIEDYRAKFF